MDTFSNGFIPYKMKTTLIKVTSYEHGALSGTLSNPYFSGELCFKSVIEFLKLMEELLDSLRCPQRAMESRTFKPSSKTEPPAVESDTPAIATFTINVLFRQNASWQGRLIWLDRKSEAQFRSVLELLMLIDGVLQ